MPKHTRFWRATPKPSTTYKKDASAAVSAPIDGFLPGNKSSRERIFSMLSRGAHQAGVEFVAKDRHLKS